MELGHVWPPFGIVVPSYLGIPLFNTVVLLSRGVTVRIVHRIVLCNIDGSKIMLVTIFFSLLFLSFQYYEYLFSEISIRDGSYGSIFYFSTGFHMLHVFAGMLFLLNSLFRLVRMHFSPVHHLGLELALIY
jgi:heme/copper-type cytochrome/quinol oxidase subunit 3